MNTLKRVLALSLALVMVLTVGVFGAFTDEDQIPEENREAVSLLVGLNILNGYEDGSFRPDGNITRAEAAKMIYVLCNAGVDDSAEIYKGQNLFTDVVAGSWYEGYVNYCHNVGIIAGRGNNTFDPDAFVTGYELMKMLLVVAEYKPDLQGYTGSSWQSNVLRDATSNGMTKGFTYSMTAPAPRHWAARLFYNTILEVNAALYIGDALITNPALFGGNESAHRVGYKRLGLEYEPANVLGTKTAKLGSGADSYRYSSVRFTENNYGTKDIDFDIPNAYLGLEVRVVYKLKNENIAVTPSNMQIFSVYPTGNTPVIETTFNDAFGTASSGTKLTLKVDGYNSGKKVTFTANETHNLGNLSYGNDYDSLEFKADAEGSIVQSVVDYFSANSGDTVRIVLNSDGNIKYIFVVETAYFRVSNINSSKHSFNSTNQNVKSLTVSVDDIIGDTDYDRDDIVAITEVYDSGDVQYDVRVIEGEKVTVSDWEIDGGAVTSVIIGDSTYEMNVRAAYNGLNRNDAYYYIDKGTVVYSSEDLGKTISLPSNVAMITGLSKDASRLYDAMNDMVGYSFKVTYMTSDGKKATKTYDITTAQKKGDRFGSDVIDREDQDDVQDFLNKLWAGTYDDITNDDLDSTYGIGKGLVRVTTTDAGVYFTAYGDYDSSNRAGDVSYSTSKGTMKVGGSSLGVVDNSVFFTVSEEEGSRNARTYGATYKVVKGSALRTISDTAGVTAQVVSNDAADIVAAYLNFADKELPSESDKKNYALLTGKARMTEYDDDEYVAVQIFDINSSGELAKKYVPVDEDSNIFIASDSNEERIEYVGDHEYNLVEYTVKDGVYTLTKVTVGTVDEIGDITSVGSSTFVIDGSRYNFDESTIVFYRSGDDITLYSEPLTFRADAAPAAAIVDDDTAVLVIVNADSNTNGTDAEDVTNLLWN